MIKSLIGPVSDLLKQVIPDPNARKEAEEKLELLEQSGELQVILGQLGINQTEAAHKSLFVAGWRPFVGWTCGVSLAYNFVLYPFLQFVCVLVMDSPPEFPVLDTGELMTVLLGMLGLGGLRTYEKYKGVSREK